MDINSCPSFVFVPKGGDLKTTGVYQSIVVPGTFALIKWVTDQLKVAGFEKEYNMPRANHDLF